MTNSRPVSSGHDRTEPQKDSSRGGPPQSLTLSRCLCFVAVTLLRVTRAARQALQRRMLPSSRSARAASPLLRELSRILRRGVTSPSASTLSAATLRQLQLDALKMAKPARLSQLVTIAESWPAMQAVVTQLLQRELRTRIAHQLLRLQHHHVLPPSKATSSLVYLHADVYEQLCSLDSSMESLSHRQSDVLKNSLIMENFTSTIQSIEGRMAGVTETLMDGLQEVTGQKTGAWVDSTLHQTSIDRFLQARIGIAVLIRHFLDLQKGASQQQGEKDGSPPVSWGAVRQHASVRDLVEDAIAEVNILSEHYYQERIPQVVIREDSQPVYATLVPSHVHHVCFEILKNAFKASIEWAKKKNANKIPPVEVGIFKGSNEVCIRIRDQGHGMSLKVLQRAGHYLWSSSVPVVKEASQASYQPVTEPMTGMGIGLPLSRLFVRHFGGDLRIISIRGHGTDVAIYVSLCDQPEAIPIKCLEH